MSEPDKYDAEAAEMLPCEFVEKYPSGKACVEIGPVGGITFKCKQCQRRPAVAARLRQDGNDMEILRGVKDGAMRQLAEANAEVARLTAEVERLRDQIDP